MMNIVETLINIYYLYLAHVSDSASAPLVGFSGALMTLSKTVLYWAQEYYCNYCAVGHNSVNDLILYWIIPNGCVCFSSYILYTFRLARLLTTYVFKVLDYYPSADRCSIGQGYWFLAQSRDQSQNAVKRHACLSRVPPGEKERIRCQNNDGSC